MEPAQISKKNIFITGASSGIGRACAERFASLGANPVISARRFGRLSKLSEELSSKFGVHVTPIHLDVRDSEQVEIVFKQLAEDGIDIDILINNAGLALSSDKIFEGQIANWETMIDTNIKGLLYVTRACLPMMMKKNKGHIVNIGSVAGHGVYPGGNVYSATKHAVRAISKSMRIDLLGTPIRVSEVDPGAVETEFSVVRWNDKERADELYQGFDPLLAEDIADAVLYCVTRPDRVNISELVVYPQAQASLTDIHRHKNLIRSTNDSTHNKSS